MSKMNEEVALGEIIHIYTETIESMGFDGWLPEGVMDEVVTFAKDRFFDGDDEIKNEFGCHLFLRRSCIYGIAYVFGNDIATILEKKVGAKYRARFREKILYKLTPTGKKIGTTDSSFDPRDWYFAHFIKTLKRDDKLCFLGLLIYYMKCQSDGVAKSFPTSKKPNGILI